MAAEHLKCGQYDQETEFLILFNLSEGDHRIYHLSQVTFENGRGFKKMY